MYKYTHRRIMRGRSDLRNSFRARRLCRYLTLAHKAVYEPPSKRVNPAPRIPLHPFARSYSGIFNVSPSLSADWRAMIPGAVMAGAWQASVIGLIRAGRDGMVNQDRGRNPAAGRAIGWHAQSAAMGVGAEETRPSLRSGTCHPCP